MMDAKNINKACSRKDEHCPINFFPLPVTTTPAPMGSVASPFPTLPNIESLRALFPSNLRGSEYSVAYVYSGVALLAFGEEKRIPELWQQIARVHADSEAAQVVAVKRLREGMTKASPLVGFPRVSLFSGKKKRKIPNCCAFLPTSKSIIPFQQSTD